MFFGVCWVGLDACCGDLDVQGDLGAHFRELLGSFSISWEPVETKLQKVSQTAATDVFYKENVCGRRLVCSRAKRVRRDRTKPTIFRAKIGSFSRPKFDTISKWFLDTCFSNLRKPAAAKLTLKLHFLYGFWTSKWTKIGTNIGLTMDSKKG